MTHGGLQSLSFQPDQLTSDITSNPVLPRGCTFSETDRMALAPFWYPVAFSHEVTDRPYATICQHLLLLCCAHPAEALVQRFCEKSRRLDDDELLRHL
jgi:hypothetical protein